MFPHSDAIAKPFRRKKAWAIGAILALPVVSLLGIFFILGYALVIAKKTLRKDGSMPEWGRAGNRLLIGGIKVFFINLFYAIPAVLLLFAGFLAACLGLFMYLQGSAAPGPAAAVAGQGLLPLFALALVLLLAAMLFGLLAALLGTASTLRFAGTGEWPRAFDFRAVFRKAFSKKFLGAYVFSMLYALVVLSAALILPVLDLILVPVVVFPVAVTFYTIMAEAYR